MIVGGVLLEIESLSGAHETYALFEITVFLRKRFIGVTGL